MTLVFKTKVPHGKFHVYNSKPHFNFKELKQIHGNSILPSESISLDSEGDGIYFSFKESVPVAIRTADCLPIYLSNQNNAAIIHAGWRGLQKQIILQAGAKFIPDFAFIGPHIFQNVYEVGAEFKTIFKDYPNSLLQSGEKLFFSQEIVARTQLLGLNPDINIQSANLDTFTQDSLHSYRRDKSKDRGSNDRNWNVFIPN